MDNRENGNRGKQSRNGQDANRRSFLKKGMLGAGAATLVAGLDAGKLYAFDRGSEDGAPITKGDIAILTFLSALEQVEADLWIQYAELGGATNQGLSPIDLQLNGTVIKTGLAPNYITALEVLDGDMPQYIADNTDDEISHAAFLSAYLASKGVTPVSLDPFRNLPSSNATGAQNTGRLTNLLSLDVDTSWYVRYRSTDNPDFGATFPQAVTINNEPAIPLNDTDTPPNTTIANPPVGDKAQRMQAIANTAGFHFGYIEQGGSSLYSIMALKATSLEVLRIIVSIGGVETNHFSLWHDKAGNAVSGTLAGVTDPVTQLTFPDLNAKGGELNQTNLILPEPCEFIRPGLPACSVVRPTLDRFGGAVATIASFEADKLFDGQPQQFLTKIRQLARAADNARRGGVDG